MAVQLAAQPARATWVGFGKPQQFVWRGTGRYASVVGWHHIGRVEEVDGRLHLYDLNGIKRADISRSDRFWAAADNRVG